MRGKDLSPNFSPPEIQGERLSLDFSSRKKKGKGLSPGFAPEEKEGKSLSLDFQSRDMQGKRLSLDFPPPEKEGKSLSPGFALPESRERGFPWILRLSKLGERGSPRKLWRLETGGGHVSRGKRLAQDSGKSARSS